MDVALVNEPALRLESWSETLNCVLASTLPLWGGKSSTMEDIFVVAGMSPITNFWLAKSSIQMHQVSHTDAITRPSLDLEAIGEGLSGAVVDEIGRVPVELVSFVGSFLKNSSTHVNELT